MPTKTKSSKKPAKSKAKAPRKPRTIRVVEDPPVEVAAVEATPKVDEGKPYANGKLSAIDAAAKVLAEEGIAMNAKALIELMALKGYWKSPGGATPHSTLYSAIHREIRLKGDKSRFVKADRGKFAIAK